MPIWDAAYFYKNTDQTLPQTPTASSKIRVRNMRHKTSISSTPTAYQQWENYPDSPELTSEYPYQYIYDTGSNPLEEITTYLFGFDAPAFIVEDSGYQFIQNAGTKGFYVPIVAWINPNEWYIYDINYFTPDPETAYGVSENLFDILKEANADIFTDNTFTDVYFAKTTNETSVSSEVRARGVFHKAVVSSPEPVNFVELELEGSENWYNPKVAYSGTKLHYCDNRGDFYTATSNPDGSLFSSTKRTNWSDSPFLSSCGVQLYGSSIYYFWNRIYENSKFYIGTTDLEGGNYTSFTITVGATSKEFILYRIFNNRIYFAYSESIGGYYQIGIASCNLDGSSVSYTTLTSTSNDKILSDLYIIGTTVYVSWTATVSSYSHGFLGQCNLALSGFSSMQVTSGSYHHSNFMFRIFDNNIYYAYRRYNAPYQDIYTAYSAIDGTGFTPTRRTFGGVHHKKPQIEVVNATKQYISWCDNSHIYLYDSTLDGITFTERFSSTDSPPDTGQEMVIYSANAFLVWGNNGIGTDKASLVYPNESSVSTNIRINQ